MIEKHNELYEVEQEKNTIVHNFCILKNLPDKRKYRLRKSNKETKNGNKTILVEGKKLYERKTNIQSFRYIYFKSKNRFPKKVTVSSLIILIFCIILTNIFPTLYIPCLLINSISVGLVVVSICRFRKIKSLTKEDIEMFIIDCECYIDEFTKKSVEIIDEMNSYSLNQEKQLETLELELAKCVENINLISLEVPFTEDTVLEIENVIEEYNKQDCLKKEEKGHALVKKKTQVNVF